MKKQTKGFKEADLVLKVLEKEMPHATIIREAARQGVRKSDAVDLINELSKFAVVKPKPL